MDIYQPIYDAVSSRIRNGDIGSAIQEALNTCNMGHYAEMAYRSIEQVAAQYDKPSAIYRPKIYVDGKAWCALYGDDLQAGVAGFGDSPAAAMDALNVAWYRKLQPISEVLHVTGA